MCMIVEGSNSCCFLKQKTNFANFPFFSSSRQRNTNSQKKRKKVTHSFSKFYSVADRNLNVDSKIIVATQGCDLKALGNFSSLPTGRHSQWLEQGLHGGGYKTARAAQCQKDSQRLTLLWESFLFGSWVAMAPQTYSRVALAIALTSYTSEGRGGTHPPYCSLSPPSILKFKAVILGLSAVLSPRTQFLLAPSFLWKSATAFGNKSFDKKCALSTKAFILSGKLGVC